MGFLPFVNHDGKRTVRWLRLFVTWLAVMLACALGTAAASYGLWGDWWDKGTGIVLGILCCVWLTVRGFAMPVEQLPSGS